MIEDFGREPSDYDAYDADGATTYLLAAYLVVGGSFSLGILATLGALWLAPIVARWLL